MSAPTEARELVPIERGEVESLNRPTALAWTDEDLQALQQTVAKDCTPAQFKVFIAACQRLSLDPFARQIVPIVMSGRMTPQVTIDGFRLIAERTRQYGGQRGPYWCGKDGVWREVWLDDGPPAAAKVGVLRRDFAEPMWGVARYKSYAKGGLWQTMPDVMLAKVAESLALRKAFPNELSGLYTQEELGSPELAEQDTAQPLRTTPDAPNRARSSAPTPTRGATNPKTTWGSLRKRAVAVGIATQGEWEDTVCQVTGKNDAKAMNDRDLAKVEAYIRDLEQRREQVVDGSLVAADESDAADAPGEYDLEDLDVPEVRI